MAAPVIILEVEGQAPGVPGQSRVFEYSVISTPPLVEAKLSSYVGVESVHWEFLDVPKGASVVFDDPTAFEARFTPTEGVTGTYLVQCTLNEGESRGKIGLAFLTQRLGLRKIAAGEGPDFDAKKGWAAAYNDLADKIEEAESAPGSVIVELGDTVAEPLASKLVAGTGVTLDVLTDLGGAKTLRVNSAGGWKPPDTWEVGDTDYSLAAVDGNSSVAVRTFTNEAYSESDDEYEETGTQTGGALATQTDEGAVGFSQAVKNYERAYDWGYGTSSGTGTVIEGGFSAQGQNSSAGFSAKTNEFVYDVGAETVTVIETECGFSAQTAGGEAELCTCVGGSQDYGYVDIALTAVNPNGFSYCGISDSGNGHEGECYTPHGGWAINQDGFFFATPNNAEIALDDEENSDGLLTENQSIVGAINELHTSVVESVPVYFERMEDTLSPLRYIKPPYMLAAPVFTWELTDGTHSPLLSSVPTPVAAQKAQGPVSVELRVFASTSGQADPVLNEVAFSCSPSVFRTGGVSTLLPEQFVYYTIPDGPPQDFEICIPLDLNGHELNDVVGWGLRFQRTAEGVGHGYPPPIWIYTARLVFEG